MEARFTLNIDSYINQLRARIWADLISLRLVKAAIADGSYASHRTHDTNGIQVEAQVPVLGQDLIDYEIRKTFISVMRNVNDYLDRIVSIILIVRKGIRAPRPMSSTEATTYINEQLEKELIDYCQKSREDFPKKLRHFTKLTPSFVRYLSNYNSLRNCYEHHKAIAQDTLQIPVRNIGLYAQGKHITMEKPMIILGGSTIEMRFIEKTIHITRGQAALLSYEDLESMVFYLVVEVPKELQTQFTKTTSH